MRFLKKKISRTIWTETAIRLYERQMEARARLGLKWCCHPANPVQRKLFFGGVEIMFDGAAPDRIAPARSVAALRLVK